MSEQVAADDKPLHFNVKSPGHGLVEQAEALCHEVNAVSVEADQISIVNPVRGYLQWKAVERKRAELRPKLAKQLGESLGGMRGAVEGAPGLMAGYLQTVSLGQSLAATLLLQTQWQRLTGTSDRKAAFLVAAASIYISVVSLVATLLLGFASLP